ncbi:MAG: hypothetical protein KC420_01565 [Myxococcales bacterium]|nr:hypothetical protein [Myxococcales bacterium]
MTVDGRGGGALFRTFGAALLILTGCGPAEDDPRARCFPEVSFDDPRLEIHVRARISAFEGPLTVELIEERWRALGPGEGISSHEFYGLRGLEGIQCLPLEEFRCIACELDDLSPLRATPITEFTCTECSLGDLSPLRSTPITEFTCTECSLGDLAPLAANDSVEAITITKSGLEDVDDLVGGGAAIPQLLRLNLSGNQIAAIHGTPLLPSVQVLELGSNRLRAAPPVAGMPALGRLNLDDNPLADLDPLAGHAGLRKLSIEGAEVTSVAALADLALWELNLRGNQIEDIGALPTGLTHLWLSDNRISRGVERIAAMPGLLVLDLARNQIPSLAGLEVPDFAGELSLEDNAITSVAGLRIPKVLWLTLDRNPLPTLAGLDAPALETLSAQGCQIGGFDGLAGSPALAEVRLADNQISGLGGLSGLGGRPLDLLDLSRNPIGALTEAPSMMIYNVFLDDAGLTSLDGIESLAIRAISAVGNAITDLSPLASVEFVGVNSVIDFSHNPISDITPLAAVARDDSDLVFVGAAITDLSQLALFKVHSVDLRENGIVDVSGLAEGDLGIRALNLADNAIASLPPLTHGLGVVSLDLSGNELTALSSRWWVSQSLNLARNQISDLSGLAGVSVHNLDLSDNALTDLDVFFEVAYFISDLHLDLSGNQLVDASGLAAISTSIWSLDLSDNALAALPAMPNASVEELDLSGNPLTSIGAVEATDIRCVGCAITSVAAIADALASAVALDLSGNPLASLDGIAGASALERLTLDEIGTGDLSALAPLLARDGFTLSARRNGIVDVAPLVGGAAYLDLSGNGIVDLSPLVDASSGSYILVDNPIDIDRSLRAMVLHCLRRDVGILWGTDARSYGCSRPDYSDT